MGFLQDVTKRRMIKALVQGGRFEEKAGFPYGAKPLLNQSAPGRLLLITVEPSFFGFEPLSAAWEKIEKGPVPHTLNNEPGTESYIFGELENAQKGNLRNGMLVIVESYSTLEHLRTHLAKVKAKLNADEEWKSMWIPTDTGFFFK